MSPVRPPRLLHEALPDLLRSDTEPTQERIDAILDVVPEYFLQAILSLGFFPVALATISKLAPFSSRSMMLGVIMSVGVVL